MNFEPDPASAAFRAEVRAFLRDRLPPEMRDELIALEERLRGK